MDTSNIEAWLRKYWFDLVVYVLVIWLIWSILTREITDLTCTDESATVCDTGSSMALAPGQPEDGDTVHDLLDKITFTARYEHNTVVWRRAFISSAVIIFITLYVVFQRFPRAHEFLMGMVVSFTVLYGAVLIWQPLITDKAVHQIDTLVEKIRPQVSSL